jgi:hypothetical protein
MGALLPATTGISQYAGQSDALSVIDGLSALMNNIQPGMRVAFSFHVPSGNLSISLHGDTIYAHSGKPLVEARCRWSLPSVVLLSDNVYSFRLVGNTIEVS